jgi:hypothetical protein
MSHVKIAAISAQVTELTSRISDAYAKGNHVAYSNFNGRKTDLELIIDVLNDFNTRITALE